MTKNKLKLLALALLCTAATAYGQRKQMVDFILPMTPVKPLVSEDIWGEANVLPRDTANGLEDIQRGWNYWDGMIVKADDGKYYMYSSAWEEKYSHHVGWTKESKAITAVSDNPMGPYRNQKLAWPHRNGGKAHNVMGLKMHNGEYAMVTSEITPGEIYTSKNPDGPWKYLDTIKLDYNGFSPFAVRYRFGSHHMSNVMILPRHDGKYMIVPRQCCILIADKVDGPYKIMTGPIHHNQPGLPDYQNEMLEDPTVWYSGGRYHILVNQHRYGISHHFTSEDGINDWKYRGVGFDTNKKLFKYNDGTLNNWYTVQRPVAFTEDGHLTHITFSVIDGHKGDDSENDNNGSKIIVVPFDGKGFDAHMDEVVADEKAAEARLAKEVANKTGDGNILNSHTASFETVNNRVGASWHIQQPEVWKIASNKAHSGKYSLEFTPGWPQDRFQRYIVHSCDYYNYSLSKPYIGAGRKEVSMYVFIEKGSPNYIDIDFKSDPYNKTVRFELNKVEHNKWVKLSQIVEFEEEFDDYNRNFQISVPRSIGNSKFYVDDVRVDYIYYSNEKGLEKKYFDFEYEDKDEFEKIAGWKTNSGSNITPKYNFITRDLYTTDKSFQIVKASDSKEKVKPFSGEQCIKYTWHTLCKYQSSWMRTMSDKTGSPDTDLWVKPGKYRLTYKLYITSEKINKFYICFKKNGKNFPIATASDKVKERNQWVTVSTIVDLSKQTQPLSTKFELLYKVAKEKTDFYIDDIQLEQL